MEKDASKRDIIAVIETSAPKVNETSSNIALVDRFEIELDQVKIKIEREMTPVDFNRIQEKPTTPKTTTVQPSTPMSTNISSSQTSSTSAITTTSSTQLVTNTTASTTTPMATTKAATNQTTISVKATKEMCKCAFKV